MKRIVLDFETRSAADLKKQGAFKYSLDPSTQPTCLAFKERGGPVTLLKFDEINKPWGQLPEVFRSEWKWYIREGFEFVAHNAFFETCIYKNILVARKNWPDIPFESFRCTAAKAAACALPRSLEGAGAAMNLTTQKDKRGYAAMLATCKPTRDWNAWTKAQAQVAAGRTISKKNYDFVYKAPKPPRFLEYKDNPEIWETLYQYCKIDVKTEELLDEALPDLIPTEQEIWFLNQRLNWRGLRVDIPTARKVVGIMERESKIRLKELDTLTMGLVTKPGARQSILDFLALEGIVLPDIRAKTVDDALKSGKLGGDMQRLLEIRKALSKTSTKKYQGFLDRAMLDERCRDILLYHGASTGRDSGTGIQPQNFPRGLIPVSKDRPYAAIQNVIECDEDMLRLLYGDNLSILFSSVLRNMLMPSEGAEFFVADFSKIEVAVLWWLADNFAGLDVLKAGKDPYKYQAAANTGKTYEEISDEGDERQLGKAQILGAGFRMGWKKFKSAAFDQYRLKLTNKQAVEAIKNYREANAPVVELWTEYEDAAIAAIETRTAVKAGKCVFKVAGGFLWIKLPSGRKLAYRSPSITWRAVTFTVLEEDAHGNEIEVEKTGRMKKTLQFLGLGPDKKSLRVEFAHGGILTENIVQAVARDLMMPAMVRLEKAGYVPLLTVHDEGICEKKIGKGTIEEFVALLCQRPNWADENLPLDAKGWKGPRYRK